jgi:hypothetical protein
MSITEQSSFPFDYWVVDDFLLEEEALALSEEFPDYDAPMWVNYSSALENKRLCNDWGQFAPATYKFFTTILSESATEAFGKMSGIDGLRPDIGLHGGGWHIHQRGGKLNVHLDYSIHPKLDLQRRLNLILYLTPNWDSGWGGGLELWSHNGTTNKPLKKEKYVECKFNRAVIFRTDQHSWHGLPAPIQCPEGIVRKSLAAYYVSPPDEKVDPRNRALFAASESQEGDASVEELIKLRQALQD